jgi:hypothetical protein
VSTVQLLGTLLPILSVVEQVAFSYQDNDYPSMKWQRNIDGRQWLGLFRPFTNAKMIHVQDNLVSKKIFHPLLSDDGEQLLEPLSNLEEVGYSEELESNAQDAFTTLLNEGGCPVSLHLVDHLMFSKPSAPGVCTLQQWC